MATTTTPSKSFFNVSITSLDGLEAQLNFINEQPGWSIIDMISVEDRIGLVYIDSNVLFDAEAPEKPDTDEVGN